MAIKLFSHNQQAYRALLDMLDQTGKAAIIHPTGTGKSFIAFKLCEDYPNKKFCWLSPSEYIFKTQLENLKSTSGGFQPENIQFITYPKLMIMSPEEVAEIQPDYIILDEFHRCGAQRWGEGVKMLLDQNPKAFLVGLSATNVRYLDNQRDMAVELFASNIASEISLGEAIVRGILNPPKYILAAFQFQNDLEKYQNRIKGVKSRIARDQAEQYLEALRRALEKADGLDEIFRKHIDNPNGKYIVFCASFEHMQEMIALSSEWFAKVDSAPHVYSAYSDDPTTDKSFTSFKADNSDHLKLLYCIDMLNEGVHVDDVDGVILLRPTISPTIYKQQIGRALSTGKKKSAVIFDIVLNIENLYSIGTIEEEMEQAIFMYRYNHQDAEVVNEQFLIIDEIRDCMELFDRLNDSLSASWELMYEVAKRYYMDNGNLEVPRRYVTSEGYSLGSWICTQRKVFFGKASGKLSDKQIEKLDAIGMRWGDKLSSAWDVYYEALLEYKKVHGNLDILARYETPDGLKLGSFISNLRTRRAMGIKTGFLTPERVFALDALGMIWEKSDYRWESNYLACLEYYLQNHNLNIPRNYISSDGLKIGVWIRRQRGLRSGKTEGVSLTASQIERLDKIGMVWVDAYTNSWEKGYACALKYYQTHGNLNVPSTYVDESGFALGRWIYRHKELRKDGTTSIKVTPERRKRLDEIGMMWG